MPRPPTPNIYPRRYFDASPTWSAWNKLTARDVHGLREEPGFEGQNVLFALNHPIRFVSVTGLAVQVELGAGVGAAKYCLVSVDDGSGAIMTVKIVRRQRSEHDTAEYPSNTVIDNLDVPVSMGIPSLVVDRERVELGTPVRVRGTLSTFRGVRQIELKRIKVLRATGEEVKAWAETATWTREVLRTPWVLSREALEKVDADARADERRKLESNRKRRRLEARLAEKRARDETKRELLEAEYNRGALLGSERFRQPWD